MIVRVDASNLMTAARVHAEAWQDAHRAFCTPDFIALHTPERQRSYLQAKMERGTGVYLLMTDRPAGIVSVTGCLIEDLYVLPSLQCQGHGTRLLRFAMARCEGTPTLWILENNDRAARLYRRMGFMETGRRNEIDRGLDEIEFAWTGREENV